MKEPTPKAREFFDLLQTSLREGRLVLPTLPEVAITVRNAVERPDATAAQISDIVQTDAALAARLIQVANSPLYRGRHEVDNVRMAGTRLGNNLVRHLVTGLVMQQMFRATSPSLSTRLHDLWQHSVQVAGLSRSLATRVAGLNADQAMLAGLIHDIGHLPILVLADGIPALANEPGTVDLLVDELHTLAGALIMKTWNFPATLAAVPAEHENLGRDPGPAADYTDVVLVANLQSRFGTAHALAAVDWSEVPAFRKLGLDPDIQVMEIEGVAEEVEEVEHILLQ